MSSVLGNNHHCEQLFNLNMNVRLETRTLLTDKHVEGSMRIATGQIKSGFEILLEQKKNLIF
jgi:hypothetical protein